MLTRPWDPRAPHTTRSTIATLSPTSAPAGSADVTITVTGTKFYEDSIVVFADVSLDTTYENSTTLKAVVPAEELKTDKTAPVIVVNPGGTRTMVSDFKVGNGSSIKALAPNTAAVGGPKVTLHVHGTGFSSSSVIVFNNGDEPTTLVSPTEVTTILNPSTASGTWTVPVAVRTGNTVSNALDFSFVEAGTVTPIVDSITPTTAVVGSHDIGLHVFGSGFTGDSKILFNHGEEPATFVSSNEVMTVVKPSTASGPWTVPIGVRNGTNDSNSKNFTFTSTTLNSLSPSSALVGGRDETLHVYGIGFAEDSVIVFNEGVEPTTFVSVNELTTGLRPSTASGDWTVPVKVRTGPTDTNSLDFSFIQSKPVVVTGVEHDGVITNHHGWTIRQLNNGATAWFDKAPEGNPLGTGAIKLTTIADSDSEVAIQQINEYKDISEFYSIKYATYAKSGGDTPAAPVVIIILECEDGGEAYLQFREKDNGGTTPDTWQEWDAIQDGEAKWWMPMVAPCAEQWGGTPAPWSEWKTRLAGVKVKGYDFAVGPTSRALVNYVSYFSVNGLVHDFEQPPPFVVSAFDQHGWSVRNHNNGSTYEFVDGPEGTPVGTGSLKLTTIADSDSEVAIQKQEQFNLLSEIKELRYTTYAEDTADKEAAPVLIIILDCIMDIGHSEVFLQFNEKDNGGTTVGEWQEWDAIQSGAALWWMPQVNHCAQTFGGTPAPWSEWVTKLEKLKIKGYDFAVGPTSRALVNYVSSFTINGVTYNFQKLS